VAGGLTLSPSGTLYEWPGGTIAGSGRIYYTRNSNATNGAQTMAPGINSINADHSHNFTSNGQSITHTHDTTVNIAAFDSASTGSGGAHNNLQPYIVLNYIIKT
jgi:microcystin-dependent protein